MAPLVKILVAFWRGAEGNRKLGVLGYDIKGLGGKRQRKCVLFFNERSLVLGKQEIGRCLAGKRKDTENAIAGRQPLYHFKTSEHV